MLGFFFFFFFNKICGLLGVLPFVVLAVHCFFWRIRGLVACSITFFFFLILKVEQIKYIFFRVFLILI